MSIFGLECCVQGVRSVYYMRPPPTRFLCRVAAGQCRVGRLLLPLPLTPGRPYTQLRPTIGATQAEGGPAPPGTTPRQPRLTTCSPEWCKPRASPTRILFTCAENVDMLPFSCTFCRARVDFVRVCWKGRVTSGPLPSRQVPGSPPKVAHSPAAPTLYDTQREPLGLV